MYLAGIIGKVSEARNCLQFVKIGVKFLSHEVAAI
jgi:hypothetical protein